MKQNGRCLNSGYNTSYNSIKFILANHAHFSDCFEVRERDGHDRTSRGKVLQPCGSFYNVFGKNRWVAFVETEALCILTIVRKECSAYFTINYCLF